MPGAQFSVLTPLVLRSQPPGMAKLEIDVVVAVDNRGRWSWQNCRPEVGNRIGRAVWPKEVHAAAEPATCPLLRHRFRQVDAARCSTFELKVNSEVDDMHHAEKAVAVVGDPIRCPRCRWRDRCCCSRSLNSDLAGIRTRESAATWSTPLLIPKSDPAGRCRDGTAHEERLARLGAVAFAHYFALGQVALRNNGRVGSSRLLNASTSAGSGRRSPSHQAELVRRRHARGGVSGSPGSSKTVIDLLP